jgi:hypothetical protein
MVRILAPTTVSITWGATIEGLVLGFLVLGKCLGGFEVVGGHAFLAPAPSCRPVDAKALGQLASVYAILRELRCSVIEAASGGDK